MKPEVSKNTGDIKTLTTDETANAKAIGDLKTATKDIGDITTLTTE